MARSTLPPVVLELSWTADPPEKLPRLAAFGDEARKERSRKLAYVFHDAGGWELAARGLTLIETGTGWSLASLSGEPRAPGAPLSLVATAIHPAGLESQRQEALPGPLRPYARLDGRRQRLHLEYLGQPLICDFIAGSLSAADPYGFILETRQIGRIEIAGDAGAALALARRLSEEAGLTPARSTVAEEALALAEGPRRPRQMPPLRGEMAVEEACRLLLAERIGTLLRHLTAIAAGKSGEPVHQARVTVRRLRALIQGFHPLLGGVEDEIKLALGGLKDVLGPARDWDVFLSETVVPIGQGLTPDDAAIAWLRRAAEAKRDAAYTVLRAWLASPAFRTLSWDLTALCLGHGWRPLTVAAEEDFSGLPDAPGVEASVPVGPPDLAAYARQILAERWRKIARPLRKVAALTDEDLHALRIKCKKLRYQVEMFETVLPGRDGAKLIRRLAAVQESMGMLNDGVVASELAHSLLAAPADVQDGVAQSMAAAEAMGLVRGFGVGAGRRDRAEVLRLWKRLLKAEIG